MLAVRLKPELDRRLAELAERTGRTKTFYARAAIEEYIEDMEDHFLAEVAMKDYDPAQNVSLAELKRLYGMNDRGVAPGEKAA